MDSVMAAPGARLGGRYRLERALSESPEQGVLWLASDTLAGEAPMALRQLPPGQDGEAVRQRISRLQGVLHPQVPRFGAVIGEGGRLWLVRDWQAGRTYRQLLEARRDRQLVFGAGEVLLLLRQLLPVLVALHGQDLLHGDISPANLLRRDSDGLPVLLDFGLLRTVAGAKGGAAAGAAAAAVGATPGYAPPELGRGEPPGPWMDLHALGVLALVLLSGDEPGALLDPTTLAWRWPAALSGEPALAPPLQRLLQRQPAERYASAAAALAALQAVPMPESTGPVPRADRTVVLVPQAPEPAPELAPDPRLAFEPAVETEAQPQALPARLAPEPLPAGRPAPEPAFRAPDPRRRHEDKEEAAEGALWPVLIALVLSAVVGTAAGWWWLGRTRPAEPAISFAAPTSLPPAEVDQRQQLLNRLRALQIDRGWFLNLVNANLLGQYPERKGRLPGDSLEDAPLRKVWNDLAEEWLARVEQLPLPLRRRLGSIRSGEWERPQQALVAQGLSPSVLSQLVSGSAQSLLPGQAGDRIPPEPFRQLWYAMAELTLDNLRLDPIVLRSQVTEVLAADVPASGARLFAVRLPADHSLALGVNGTPLLQMAVFAADGSRLEARGPLRVVSLGQQKASPVQLLITNEGVAPARISLSLRADPPPPPTPQPTTAPSEGAAPAELPPGAVEGLEVGPPLLVPSAPSSAEPGGAPREADPPPSSSGLGGGAANPPGAPPAVNP